MIIGFIRDYKERGERFNLEGVKVIKRAKSEVQAQKTVNMAVLNCLNSLEDFWNTNIFYSKLVFLENEYCDVLVISYFEDAIKTLKDELKKYIVEEKDAEDIKKLNETRLLTYLYDNNTPMPVKVLFDYIDYNVKYMELEDRYEGKNNKAEIFRMQFVKDTIQLEIYRCIVKESTASEKELRFEYSPCI